MIAANFKADQMIDPRTEVTITKNTNHPAGVRFLKNGGISFFIIIGVFDLIVLGELLVPYTQESF